MKPLHYLLFTLTLFAASPIANGQTVKQLEDERKATLKKMEATNKMINQTKQSQQSSLNKLNLLSAGIRERQTLIRTINREVEGLDSEIRRLGERQTELQDQLSKAKDSYARMLQESYLHRETQSKLLFVLSAETFNQSLRRMRYLHQYASYRRNQAEEIKRLTEEIALQNLTAEQHRHTRLEVLKQKESENKQLAADRKEENRLLANLKNKEKELRAELAAQQKQATRLNEQIEQLIAEEIRREEERQKAASSSQAGKDQATSTTRTTRQEEDPLLSGNFEANKGRLPWPVAEGVITGKFGIHPHPVLKAVTTNNKGIYIQTPENTEARSVYEGVVTQCFSIPGNNNAVIVKHGTYRTVYANLTSLYVKEGDKLSPRQRIGKIYTDDLHENKTELYFQLWKEKTLLDPEPWLSK